MRKRILVIDDDEAIRKSFLLALEDTTYVVDAAESGEKALEVAHDNKYGLIFLDLKMPGLDGVQTLRELRRIDNDVPIYIITAFYQEFLQKLKRAEEDSISFDVFQKPFSSEQIVLVTVSILEGPIGH